MTRIPILCRYCGNARLVDREPDEGADVRVVSMSHCDLCEDGESSETLYHMAAGSCLTWSQLMDRIDARSA